MESLHQRVLSLKHIIDTDYSLYQELAVSEALNQLNTSMNIFINNNNSFNKLFKTLNASNMRLYQERYGREELEIERAFIESNITRIEQFVAELSKLDHKTEFKIDIDTSILSHSAEISRQYEDVTNLRLKYNQLIIRSINLLQNYLKLNDNMNKFYRNVATKIDLTCATS